MPIALPLLPADIVKLGARLEQLDLCPQSKQTLQLQGSKSAPVHAEHRSILVKA